MAFVVRKNGHHLLLDYPTEGNQNGPLKEPQQERASLLLMDVRTEGAQQRLVEGLESCRTL